MKNLLALIFFLSSVQLAFTQEEKSEKSDRDVAKNGSYVDGLAAYGVVYVDYSEDDFNYYDNYSSNLFGVGLRFGTEWYWQRSINRKMGINVIWATTTFQAGNEVTVQLLPLNIGLANIWKLKETLAIEANLNVGYAVRFVGNTGHGISINPEVKFRLERILVGLGYQYIYSSDSFYTINTHQLILSVGMFQH